MKRSITCITACLLAGAAWAQPAPASKAPASKAPASAPPSTAPASQGALSPALPALIRAGLNGRMIRHGKALGGLEAAVNAMNFLRITQHAQSIVGEPRLARPLPTEPSANSGIPAAFFTYQDELHTHAKALLDAATAKDAARVKAAHAALGQVCGKCHRLWLPTAGEP